jgi:hypothetical protein
MEWNECIPFLASLGLSDLCKQYISKVIPFHNRRRGMCKYMKLLCVVFRFL